MTTSQDAYDVSEPLCLFTAQRPTPEIFGDARCLRFEYTSRGDRVPGRLLLPAVGDGPFPLVLLQHGLRGNKEALYLDAAAPWVRGGAAVAGIDFPLHGERSSAKLSEALFLGTPNQGNLGSVGTLLWTEFSRQAVLDLHRCADALLALPEIDPDRFAYAGFSLGAMLGAAFCAADSRPRAAALALAGAGLGPSTLDPRESIGRIAPRPVLFVNAESDEVISRDSTEALYASASEPKQICWFEGTHNQLPGAALKCMWSFLKEQLEVR